MQIILSKMTVRCTEKLKMNVSNKKDTHSHTHVSALCDNKKK